MVGQAWPKLYEPDYTPYITAILNAKPDVLVTSFWGGTPWRSSSRRFRTSCSTR